MLLPNKLSIDKVMIREKISKMIRLAKHLLRSGSLLGSADHFLVILPSVLVMANAHLSSGNPIIELSTIFCMCGLGEIAFLLTTGGKVPLIVGPSFAHISLAAYYISTMEKTGSGDQIHSTLLWAYFFSGCIILLLAFLYRINFVKRAFRFLFPDAVMGPSISLIGLGVASLAIEDTGFYTENGNDMAISLITLAAIILLALTRRKHLRNATILLGIFIGCLYAFFRGDFDFSTAVPIHNLIILPNISFSWLRSPPQNWLSMLLLVIPPSIVSFIESLGRITILDGMYQQTAPDDNNYTEDKLFCKALSGHGVAHLFSVAFGSAPCAIYAENIAVMNMDRISGRRDIEKKHEDATILKAYNEYSIYPYVFASILFLAVACIRPFQNFFYSIPKPVIGGMELFIFGLVAAPGIQLLVEKRVDYNRISNQVITASVLIAGISGISIQFATVELSGMGLGLVIGFVLNLATNALSKLGILNEQVTLEEAITICGCGQFDSITLTYKVMGQTVQCNPCTKNKFEDFMRQEEIVNQLQVADDICLKISCHGGTKKIAIKKYPDWMDITFPMGEREITQIHNDYPDFFISSDDDGKEITIRVRPEMSSRVLREISLKSGKAPYVLDVHT